MQARDLLRSEHDQIRRVAVLEPRGHPALLAAALLPPVSGDQWRVVFMDATGYPDMCGHATIGVATTLVEEGLVAAREGICVLSFDTPAGPIKTELVVSESRVQSVKLVNRPSFQLDVIELNGPSGAVAVPIAYGGQWYAFVDAAAFGLSIEPSRVGELVTLAAGLRAAVAEAPMRADPRTGRRPTVSNVMWSDDPSECALHGRQMPVNSAGAFDRSPCGTGTSARLAVLHAAGRLQVGETHIVAGLLNTKYQARIAQLTEVEDMCAVVPEVTGSAWITGHSTLRCDHEDPLAEGFLL